MIEQYEFRDAVKNEQELYEIVVKSIEDRLHALRESKHKGQREFAKLVEKSGNAIVRRKPIGNKNLYIIGEHHHSRSQIDYFHRELFDKLCINRYDWVFFREGAGDIVTYPHEDPSLFYFQKIAMLFEVPILEAIADLRLPENQKYLSIHAHIESKAIDSTLINSKLAFMTCDHLKTNTRETINDLAKWIKRDPQYVYSLLQKGPLEEEIFKQIDPHWNTLSKERLQRILPLYSRSNVLISVGAAHLPAFEEV